MADVVDRYDFNFPNVADYSSWGALFSAYNENFALLKRYLNELSTEAIFVTKIDLDVINKTLTLSESVSLDEDRLLLFVDGILQIPDTDYLFPANVTTTDQVIFFNAVAKTSVFNGVILKKHNLSSQLNELLSEIENQIARMNACADQAYNNYANMEKLWTHIKALGTWVLNFGQSEEQPTGDFVPWGSTLNPTTSDWNWSHANLGSSALKLPVINNLRYDAVRQAIVYDEYELTFSESGLLASKTLVSGSPKVLIYVTSHNHSMPDIEESNE